ncbi:hypothetical protein H0W80_02260 [Candidatus Saccharibacteria bacterium]|nr:hypothetical protein [Candidatus Saccharibacteria bacterium]
MDSINCSCCYYCSSTVFVVTKPQRDEANKAKEAQLQAGDEHQANEIKRIEEKENKYCDQVKGIPVKDVAHSQDCDKYH